jgi:hypothetical protein
MKQLAFTVTGMSQLLISNPQAVDPFNKFSKAMKQITGKKKKTEEDLLQLRELEVMSKLYFNDEQGVYIPSTWVLNAIQDVSFSQAKIAKKRMRGGVFIEGMTLKLNYEGMNTVKEAMDIVKNERFIHTQPVKQGQVKIMKSYPAFSKWSFDCEFTFDPEIVDESTLKDLINYACKYGGFGDFRPNYGRAKVEFK